MSKKIDTTILKVNRKIPALECPVPFLKTDSITSAFLKILHEFPSVFYKSRAVSLEHNPTTASVNCTKQIANI